MRYEFYPFVSLLAVVSMNLYSANTETINTCSKSLKAVEMIWIVFINDFHHIFSGAVTTEYTLNKYHKYHRKNNSSNWIFSGIYRISVSTPDMTTLGLVSIYYSKNY